jgi:hypothetical protein
MDNEVMVCIGVHRIFLSPEEAFQICSVINAASHVAKKWQSGGNIELIEPPSTTEFIARIVPVTAHMRMTWEQNANTVSKK